MSDSLWSIYNRAEEVRIDGLHAYQIKALLKNFESHSFSQWLIWQEGWVDWQELETVVDSLFPGVRERQVSIRSVPKMQQNSGVIAEQSPLTYNSIDVRSLTLDAELPQRPLVPVPKLDELVKEAQDQAKVPDRPVEAKQDERRANTRFLVPMKLFLHIDGGVAKNETEDISLSGMKLKSPLQKEPKGSFDVTLLYQGTELALKCKLISSADDEPRTRLMIEKCNRIDVLRGWIIAPKKKESA
jgi:hypothetical protein